MEMDGAAAFLVTAPPVPGSGRRGGGSFTLSSAFSPFRGLGGDRRIEYPGELQGLLVGKILFTLLFHKQSSYLSPRSGAFFLGPSGARCSWASFCAAFSCSAIGGWRLASL